jgi:hypothetical protein
LGEDIAIRIRVQRIYVCNHARASVTFSIGIRGHAV